MKQLFFKSEHPSWKHRHSHGGVLRKLRAGRKMRVLSSKDPIHLVLKANKDLIRGGLRSYKRYFLIQKLVRVYSKRFFVKIEQISIQADHVHLLIRITRTSLCHNFLRVLSGQIAQQFQSKGLVASTKNLIIYTTDKLVTGTLFTSDENRVTDTPNSKRTVPKRLWKYRPFTRVVKGYKAYRIVRDYISLNEAEALGVIAYSKLRLRGLSSSQLAQVRTFLD